MNSRLNAFGSLRTREIERPTDFLARLAFLKW